MTKLRVFKPTGKKCRWHGCNRSAKIYSGRHEIKGKRIHCVRHTYMKISGRVNPFNYSRDHYRQHLKSQCAMFGTTFKSKYNEIKKFSEDNGSKLDKFTIVKNAISCFEIDHINGNHFDNRPSNLQTLCSDAHKLKSNLNGDYSRRYEYV